MGCPLVRFLLGLTDRISNFRGRPLSLFLSAKSAEQVITRDVPKGLYAIFPGDLLAFRIGSSPIRYGNFVDTSPSLGHLGCHLRLEPAPVLFEVYRL